MLLRTFWDARLAQYAYLVGCQETGEALIIDPARYIAPYLEMAAAEGLHIVGSVETHIHADFVSGSRELAQATGAAVYLSAEGGTAWQYDYPSEDRVQLVRDGDRIIVGQVILQAMHTPGHTPEHMMYLLTDTRTSDQPLALFSGDCLFVGDVGRPDLLDQVAGTDDRREAAYQQYANVQHLRTLPDYLQVLPGHGAGSACGKALGSVPSSTLGYEKLVSPAFQFEDEAAFADWLLDGQPAMPHYFRQMKQVNRVGARLLSDLVSQPVDTSPAAISLQEGAIVIDTRPAAAYIEHHLPRTISIPAHLRSFSTYAGWYVDYAQPTYLFGFAETLSEAAEALRAIGVDDLVQAVITDDRPYPLALATITPQAAHDEQRLIVDIRNANELAEVRIADSLVIHMGDIPAHINTLPTDRPLAVICGSGVRSAIVASLLQSRGFTDVASVTGGIDAWQKNGLPIVTG